MRPEHLDAEQSNQHLATAGPPKKIILISPPSISSIHCSVPERGSRKYRAYMLGLLIVVNLWPAATAIYLPFSLSLLQVALAFPPSLTSSQPQQHFHLLHLYNFWKICRDTATLFKTKHSTHTTRKRHMRISSIVSSVIHQVKMQIISGKHCITSSPTPYKCTPRSLTSLSSHHPPSRRCCCPEERRPHQHCHR